MKRLEDKGWRIEDRRWIFGSILYLLSSILFLSGCSSSSATTQPSSVRAHQDALLANPGDYDLPHVDDHVSSGGIGDFDKQGFKRDMDNVLNP